MAELMNDIAIKADSVSMVFTVNGNTKVALDEISFSLKQGEVVGIIGYNGSGKSTLLKVLGGILAPTHGKVVYSGRLVSVLEVGSGFHPDLSGRENIHLYCSVLGMSSAEISRITEDVIHFSEIGEHIDNKVKYYSNGMFLRLAFSIIFFIHADILLLDEVVSVGDVRFMDKCYKELTKKVSNGLSMIITSHNYNDIIKYCSRTIWLDNGRIRNDGPTEEVLNAYLYDIRFSGQDYFNFDSSRYRDLKDVGIDIEQVEVRDEYSAHTLNYNSDWYIEIQYRQFHHDDAFSFVIVAEDELREILFITAPTYQLPAENQVIVSNRGEGLYSCKVIIPARTINIGRYYLNLRVIDKNDIMVAELKNVADFKIDTDNHLQKKPLLKSVNRVAIAGKWEFSEIR